MIVETAKLTKNNRITIPKRVREEMNWEPGQVIELVRKGAGFALVPVEGSSNSPKQPKKVTPS